ncbi:MAG: hypothetical protein HQK51_15525 [Oligoflexia bacterium]|nr:hypothetical protein [Oligoflexia bacterium]
MKLFVLVIVFIMFIISSCSNNAIRGVVAMKIDDQIGHISLGDSEVKKGDKVAIYKQDCPARNNSLKGGSSSHCSKTRIGEGEISEILNENYSVVNYPNEIKVEEGDIVEKIR